jgi:hypothetical protein
MAQRCYGIAGTKLIYYFFGFLWTIGAEFFLKGVENSHRKPCSDYQLMINPLGFMPNLSMRGVDNSIDNEEMLSA